MPVVKFSKGIVRYLLQLIMVVADDLKDNYFNALEVYNCLASVPLNKTVASQLIGYYKDTLEFQSTLTYLRNPPSSYQQPSTDLLGGLDQISRDLEAGAYSNEFSFEIALLDLAYSAHDGHLYFYGGASNVFSFGSPFDVSSVSVDGTSPPQIFITEDLNASLHSGYTPSPIATVNGQPALQFYQDFAKANSLGYLDSHADWNNLFYSPAADIQGIGNAYTGSSPFYPGDVFSLVFENGTGISDFKWVAVLNDINDEGAALSVAAWDNNFVSFGDLPNTVQNNKKKRNVENTTATQSSSASSTPASWTNAAYPTNPFVAQPDLGNGGVVSGYLVDEATAVLSLPNFDVYDEHVESFSATVGDFLMRSKSSGAKQIVIDLQQNYGGNRLLAVDTAKQFFPEIDFFGGSRERRHETADVLGYSYTDYYTTHENNLNASFVDFFAESLWVAPTFINAATGRNFSSWAEYFAPHEDRLDYFSTIQRDNLSSTVFDKDNLGIDIPGYPKNNTKLSSPYDASNIVLLTDALCSSTCALFFEMMHHEAGVKTIVAGGLPNLLGPMQAVAGSRGARDYEADLLDIDIYGAVFLNSSLSSLLPDRDIDFNLDTANFNLQDQIRRSEDFPLQFAYEAANCRIYYTPSTIFNMTDLWQHAAAATWTDPSLCVKYSTDHPSSTNTTTDTVGPSAAQKSSWQIPSLTPPTPSEKFSFALSSLAADPNNPESDISGPLGSSCDPAFPGQCQELTCVQAPWCSPKGVFMPKQFQCVRLVSGVCAKGQTTGTGACKKNTSGQCKFCKPRVLITSQSCGSSTSDVKNDRVSEPYGGGR